jgi:hypothetical protein
MKERAQPDEPDPKAFERFKDMARRLIAVPKKQVDAAAARKAAQKRRKRD